MTQVKTYLTQNGAEAFAKRLRARFPHKMFQISAYVETDFRDRFFVEVLIGEDGDGKVYWIGCGPLAAPTRKLAEVSA